MEVSAGGLWSSEQQRAWLPSTPYENRHQRQQSIGKRLLPMGVSGVWCLVQ